MHRGGEKKADLGLAGDEGEGVAVQDVVVRGVVAHRVRRVRRDLDKDKDEDKDKDRKQQQQVHRGEREREEREERERGERERTANSSSRCTEVRGTWIISCTPHVSGGMKERKQPPHVS